MKNDKKINFISDEFGQLPLVPDERMSEKGKNQYRIIRLIAFFFVLAFFIVSLFLK